MKLHLTWCVASLMLWLPPAHAQMPFSLEQVTNAPFPSELTAAPSKGRVAWVFNAQGCRNLWVAEPASDGSYKARQATSYSSDDGQDLGQLSWAPDAATVVFTRGGDLEFLDRPYPNPQSSPQGVEQGVWALSLDSRELKLLGEGHSPSVSPKGDSVAYLFKGQVWLAKLSGGKPEQLIHANGESNSLRWSPDGSKLAFTSRRGDHGFIGVYDFAAKSLAYLDPSVDSDHEDRFPLGTRRLVASLRRSGKRRDRQAPHTRKF